MSEDLSHTTLSPDHEKAKVGFFGNSEMKFIEAFHNTGNIMNKNIKSHFHVKLNPLIINTIKEGFFVLPICIKPIYNFKYAFDPLYFVT